MQIAILTYQKEATTWKKALQAKLPNVRIDIFGESEEAIKAPFLVCWKPKKDQLQSFVNLKVIQSLGAGVDHIFDTNKIAEAVKVVRIIDPHLTIDMWEFTLAATLDYLKNFTTYNQQKNLQIWKGHPYKTISNTTVSIMGLGKIGGYVAQQFAKVGFIVQGWSNSRKSIAGVESFAGSTGLTPFLNTSEVLINILPLTATTRGILSKKLFQQLPKGSYLINVGRGGHLVETDLIPFLDSGHLSGATLDVFQQEPLPTDHPFWRHPKIQITPHVASLTNVESAVNQVVSNYQRMMNGQELLNEVSPLKGY